MTHIPYRLNPRSITNFPPRDARAQLDDAAGAFVAWGADSEHGHFAAEIGEHEVDIAAAETGAGEAEEEFAGACVCCEVRYGWVGH